MSTITPMVVPLLVTDTMESAFSARTTNVVRQYALALSALIKGFNLTTEMEGYSDSLLATVGNDYNSLYSVARLSNNTIRVRMGAMLQNTAQYAMVPQNRDVTLLVMVPKNIGKRGAVSVMSRTEFVLSLIHI